MAAERPRVTPEEEEGARRSVRHSDASLSAPPSVTFRRADDIETSPADRPTIRRPKAPRKGGGLPTLQGIERGLAGRDPRALAALEHLPGVRKALVAIDRGQEEMLDLMESGPPAGGVAGDVASSAGAGA